ncbi:translation elongation factor G [Capsaspora owczarzaki ATCC 30864]|uniref:Elongation factor G, mitochondrial n=1 Tax=Capsaspora owczarzaki (strain ATCC 30864) TaxID=595528 RepID=A0A0D2WKL4_CAPO3|nr:translation elongation factor G [Capsaspora owczarzaki ATCC 30864]KJE90148.1 translation elongation factor G [Capsaspora owczarzaki ATCC 30864]|eukprot:XP_004364364.2 translation elongation factor G [Capsaspora owczarzaki ATCC 30864]
MRLALASLVRLCTARNAAAAPLSSSSSPSTSAVAAAALRAAPVCFSSIRALSTSAVASSADGAASFDLARVRNIGISAHIDSGKTTLTERILFYTGRIKEIHEVKGRDGVGATMDHMDLEREKGITIQSAATYTRWLDHNINIIDTPGHVDFTIEVERSLRVLDGAVLVLCGVGGVQSQTLTVDRQMKRYNVPAIAFVNKLDRPGANAFKICEQLRNKLRHNAAMLQVPIGAEENFTGVVDLIDNVALYNEGTFGETIRREAPPAALATVIAERRALLIEAVADVDDELGELFLNEVEPTADQLRAAVRRATISRKFTPVLCGTALKNKGVQMLLNSIVTYMPNPTEIKNYALDLNNNNEKVLVHPENLEKEPFLGLAFKLEEGRFGQLTYLRVYQGRIRRGEFIMNARDRKKIKVPRLVQMHANEMEEIQEAHAGQICAMFGVDCASGDTFTDGTTSLAMTSMFVPEPVISLAIRPERKDDLERFSKALGRFTKEDPTFRLSFDADSKETIISGMGELHLEVYLERMKREYNCPTISGKPKVAFRETITAPVNFDYLHKKQSGGSGQYGRVIGTIEPIGEEAGDANEFTNTMIGMNIAPAFVPAIERGFQEACDRGSLTGNRIVGIRFDLKDGQSHPVDSNELAFRLAARGAVRQAYANGSPILLEPIMKVEITIPEEHQGAVSGQVNRRKGMILDSEVSDGYCVLQTEVPLNNMFGYSTELRSATQGKGEFSMEYVRHAPVPMSTQLELVRAYEKERGGKKDE